MDELASFRTFRTIEEARAFVADLEDLGFAPVLEDNSKYLSGAIVGAVPDYFVVKLPPGDFLKAERALDDAAEKELAEVAPDHYLFAFSTEELLDVVRKPDENHEQFYRWLLTRNARLRGIGRERHAREEHSDARETSARDWVAIAHS